METSPRRAISRFAAATAAAAEAREAAVNCCRPMVSFTTPWLVYSCTALLAIKRGVASAPAALPGASDSGSLGVEKLIVIRNARQQRRSRNGAVERADPAGGDRRGEARLVGLGAADRLVERDRRGRLRRQTDCTCCAESDSRCRSPGQMQSRDIPIEKRRIGSHEITSLPSDDKYREAARHDGRPWTWICRRSGRPWTEFRSHKIDAACAGIEGHRSRALLGGQILQPQDRYFCWHRLRSACHRHWRRRPAYAAAS